ncbi:histone deacetylase complex subunit SAP130-like [Galendromus occidentalis]|uniref:Histone deacetylase complex subunit SAP130-like n=1 Tax=Galendromus occidentalis TaxID=34638 RepID=A0AAJ7P965_9ACAR|nr:histone deacetylase complex subunit SAP130-like [Galendromus occidentalis]
MTAATITPIDLARAIVQPTRLQDDYVTVTPAQTRVTVTGQTTLTPIPRVQPQISLIPATVAPGPSTSTPSPSPVSHLIVPPVAAVKSTALRPSIRPLQPASVLGTNVEKMMAAAARLTPRVARTPTVVPFVRAPVVSVQQTTIQPVAQQSRQRTKTPAALIRPSNHLTSHVPRGPAAVASIAAGPKTALATPIIRQTTGSNVVPAPGHIPVGARVSAAALTPPRTYAPVTMVEVPKTKQSVGKLHLSIPPSITIEPRVRPTVWTGAKPTAYSPAVVQPTSEKTAPTTPFYKTGGTSAPTQFNNGNTTFTPINTPQAQATIQPISNAPASPAVTVTNRVTVTNSKRSNKASPVYVSNKANMNNVVITTQRPVSVRNVPPNPLMTTPSTNHFTMPMANTFQQSLNVTGSDVEVQPRPIGFLTPPGPRLQVPVINVGQNVQPASAGAVVLNNDVLRGNSSVPFTTPGAFFRYETYPASAYFNAQSGASNPMQMTAGGLPGVRSNSSFSSQRPLMVTVDAKAHPSTSSRNVISVTATKADDRTKPTELNAVQNFLNPEIAAGLQRISSETTITKLATPPPASITVTAIPSPGLDRVTTSVIEVGHSTKIANLTEKVITQALSGGKKVSGSATPPKVRGGPLPNTAPGIVPLPITVTTVPSASKSNQQKTMTPKNQQKPTTPTNQQATQGSPSRPSILRKRSASTADAFNALLSSSVPSKKGPRDERAPASMKQESTEENSYNHTSGDSAARSGKPHEDQKGPASPRKKPRKQFPQLSETGGEARPGHREQNGKDHDATINQRPQLFGRQQPGWKARLNHFLRHSDVRCKDDQKPSVNELANQKSAAQRAHGWKLFHIRGQVEEVETIESDVVHRFEKILEDFETSSRAMERSSFGPEDERMLTKIADLIKGNLQRSKIMQDHMIEVKKQLGKVLEHKGGVLNVIGKHVSKRPLKKREML